MSKKNWDAAEIEQLFNLPFLDLLFEAQTTHRQHFKANEIEFCSLLSIKTGACPEDCAYCPQSGHYKTDLPKEKLLDVNKVRREAAVAKKMGATRFCMGAAWRNPPAKDFPKIVEMIKAVKDLGMEACVTLVMLTENEALQLKEAGLDYYNHNLDTSPEYYKKIISTRTYEDRLNTLNNVQNAGLNVCCGGIIGMGEERKDRVELLAQLANLPEPPKSVPINRLIRMPGTPLAEGEDLDNLEFVRTIAVARIMMPTSMVRLSAGRLDMSDEMQTLCFMAGANSIFLGDRLLTADNPTYNQDKKLFEKLGMQTKQQEIPAEIC